MLGWSDYPSGSRSCWPPPSGKLPQRLYHGINEDEAGSSEGEDVGY